MSDMLIQVMSALWLTVGVITALCNFKDVCDVKKRGGLGEAVAFFMFICIIAVVAGATVGVISFGRYSMLAVRSLPELLVKGVPVMLRRLFSFRASLMIMAVCWLAGVKSPNLMDRSVEWYNAPPPPPSAEARRMIDSITSTDDWVIGRSGSDKESELSPCIQRSNVRIYPLKAWCEWLTDSKITISDRDCSNQFSRSDRRAICTASSSCLRKLTIRAVDQNIVSSK